MTGWRSAGEVPQSALAEEMQEDCLSQDRLKKCRRTASVRTGWTNAGGLPQSGQAEQIWTASVRTGWRNIGLPLSGQAEEMQEGCLKSGEAHFPIFYSLQRASHGVCTSFLSCSISHLTLSEKPTLYQTRLLISDVPRWHLCKVSEIMQHSTRTNLNMAAWLGIEVFRRNGNTIYLWCNL
jgi:hypothetical protein